MRKNRKEIDKFLIILDGFIKRYSEILSEDDIFELTIPFKITKPSSFGTKDMIPLSTLTPLINKQHNSKYNNGVRTRRGSGYLRRVAYKIDFIQVKGSNYEEIFKKILSNKGNTHFNESGLILKDFYDDYGETFIIPEDYGEINRNMLFKGNYEIIK